MLPVFAIGTGIGPLLLGVKNLSNYLQNYNVAKDPSQSKILPFSLLYVF